MFSANTSTGMEKVRAQEAELRALRGQVNAVANGKAWLLTNVEKEGATLSWVITNPELRTDPLHEAEAALKALRETTDQESRRRAAEELEKSSKKVREQLKKPETPPAGK
jgi:hypothetical protein